MRRSVRWVAALLGAATVVSLALAGCTLFDGDQRGDSASVSPIPIAEKERLGYDRPEDSANPALQRLANTHRAEIEALVVADMRDRIGREVQVTSLAARGNVNLVQPDTVDVMFRTLDEPVIAASVAVRVSESGVGKGVDAQSFQPGNIREDTVSGLYRMAYRDRIAKQKEYLAATYPQFGPMPAGYMAVHQWVDPVIWVSLDMPIGQVEPHDKMIDAIYDAYQVKPERTDAEWRSLFEKHAAQLHPYVAVTLVLSDPAVMPTADMVTRVADELRSSKAFDGTYSWYVSICSQLMQRNGVDFERELTATYREGQLVRWVLNCTSPAGSGLDPTECETAASSRPD